MRRAEREITEKAEIEKILREAPICRLGMVDEKGEPYVVPLNFGYNGGTLYFHGATEGRKIDILRRGGRVCFEVSINRGVFQAETPCDWDWRFKSVIGYGTPRFIENPGEKQAALALVMAHYSEARFDFPIASLVTTAVYAVKIETMTGKEYRPV